jgi:hypothetical protein
MELNEPHVAQLLREEITICPVLDTASGLVGLGVGAHLGSGEAAMDRQSVDH